MCDTSKTPTAVRTAICSAVKPQQSTGISQPPKSTIFAFAARCTAFNAVLLSSIVSAIVGSFKNINPQLSTIAPVWLKYFGPRHTPMAGLTTKRQAREHARACLSQVELQIRRTASPQTGTDEDRKELR